MRPIRIRFMYSSWRWVCQWYIDGNVPNYRLKEQVLIRDVVSFKWKVAWLYGVEVVMHDLLVRNVVVRGVSLPDGWLTALRALSLLKDARRILKADLPLDVEYLECDLIGKPKHVPVSTGPRCSGTCVTFMERGRPVSYILVAHVHSDIWICSPGASVGYSLLGSPVWDTASCVEKDLSCELWSSAAVSKRRVGAHMLAGNLRQLLVDNSEGFDVLVAHKTWEAEVRRASIEERNIDVEVAGAMYEKNPFRWGNDHVLSHVSVGFCWRWKQAGSIHFMKKMVAIYDACRGAVPLPDGIITDASLYKRLLNRATQETKQSYCPCKYLGLRTDAGYEPDPAKWPVEGRKTNEKIWIQFLYVRNALTNMPHRVQIHANNWLSRTNRLPGSPLNITAARSLRFSLEFMDAFAENKLSGMSFRGVTYEGAERPEILYHLSNDIDIQNEMFWWDLPSGGCICKSLLQLSDETLGMTTPEGDSDAYQIVGSELGYDTLGIPDAEQDHLLSLMYDQLF